MFKDKRVDKIHDEIFRKGYFDWYGNHVDLGVLARLKELENKVSLLQSRETCRLRELETEVDRLKAILNETVDHVFKDQEGPKGEEHEI